MKNFLSFFGAVSIVILAILILIPILCPKWLYLSSDKPIKAACIIQLLGSIPDRSLQTASLYKDGFSKKIILVHENIDLYKPLLEKNVRIPTDSDLVKSSLLQMNIPEEDILIIPGNTLSTQDEAITLAEYFINIFIKSGNNLDSLPHQILVVTSKFHSGRSDRIFESVFKTYGLPIRINTIASEYDTSNPVKWYKNREDIADALMEGIKILNFLLREQFQIAPSIKMNN